MTDAESGLSQSLHRFGMLAYFGAGMSLAVCFSKSIILFIAPIIGLTLVEMNPHLQAVMMWVFAAVTVAALYFDRTKHGDYMPLTVGFLALVIIIGTLYTYYHVNILMFGYVLLVVAAFVNQTRMLSSLNRAVRQKSEELADLANSLEQRVSLQVGEIERLARLKRFLPGEVAELVTSEEKESLLESHRRYIACLFCDIRRFTTMTEVMEPEDVMDVLRSFHESVGRLVVRYQGTIGFRAGDGVLVFFNDPLPCDDPDLRACRLALEIQKAFEELRHKWARLNVDIGLGIGIASGYATMGVIGIEGRFDYTAIGNAVNLAARLSDQAKDGEILISRRTFVEVESFFATRSIDDLSVKGLAEPVNVHLLEGLKEDSGVVPLSSKSTGGKKQEGG